MVQNATHTFMVDTVGENTGEAYKGTFKVRVRMSHRDSLREDEVRRGLLGANPDAASDRAKSIAYIFAVLSVRIIDCPSWWANSDNGLALEDDNVVKEVFDQTVEASAKALEELKNKAEEARKQIAADK